MRISRRDFVRSAVVAAAAAPKKAAAKPRRAESLAVDGGLKAVTLPDDRHLTAIKWPRYGEEEKRRILELLDNNRFLRRDPSARTSHQGVSRSRACQSALQWDERTCIHVLCTRSAKGQRDPRALVHRLGHRGSYVALWLRAGICGYQSPYGMFRSGIC